MGGNIRLWSRDTQTSLAAAATALGPGQYVDFTAGQQTAWQQDVWEWQAHGHYDPVRKIVHVMGKPANNDSTWSHRYWIETSAAWTDGGSNMWANFGHVYGNLAINPSNGDLFIARGGLNGAGQDAKRLRRWRYADRSWGYLVPSNGDIYGSGLQDVANGVACHPHWFGTDDPLVAIDTNFRAMAVRVNTDQVFDMSHADTAYGQEYGVGVYPRRWDCLLLGGAGGQPLLKLTKNGTSTPTQTSWATPPIPTTGNTDTGAGGFGSLHEDPTDPSRLILVERGGSYRWWTANEAGTFTRRDTQLGAHPFQFRPFTVVSLVEYGVLWALGYNDTGPVARSRLWKPG